MGLDALIIADAGTDSVSGSSPMRFSIDGQPATIQAIYNYLQNQGKIVPPIAGDNHLSWSSAAKLNGIALLSSLQHHGFKAKLINDFNRERERFEHLLMQSPKAILVSTTFIVGKAALQNLVSAIRNLAPGITIIAGGPFVFQSHLIHQRRNDPDFFRPEMQSDFLFLGSDDPEIDLYITAQRGLESLHAALDCLRAGRSLQGLPNTAWRDRQGTYQFGTATTPAAGQFEDRINWDTLPEEVFASKVVPLQASSGCPFRCAFCNFVKDHHSTYAKSIEQILEEMKAAALRGAKYIWFVDDIFRLGQGDLNAFSAALLAADLDLRWMSFIRADTVSGVDFGLLKKAGCHELQLGLESADPTVLAAMNKKSNPETYRTTVCQALAAGINVSSYFVFGHPGETAESLSRTTAFLQEIQYPELPGSLSWSIYPFLLVPLSPIFEPDQRHRYDLHGYMMNWRHATMDFPSAVQAIKRTIMALDDSAPIYRNDNLAMLEALAPSTRREFFRTRLRLAKLTAAGQATPETVYRRLAEILKNT
jgi:anaerobic magnesium-protoporphyrin IX monomethyl ester cyclase